MRIDCPILFIALLLLACLFPQFLQAAQPGADDLLAAFEPRTYTDPSGKTLLYRLHKPANYDPKRPYPLLLFLHGAGGRGSDNKGQLLDGGGPVRRFLTPASQEKFPCFILAPQCPANKRWVDVDWGLPAHTQPPQPTDELRMTMEVLTALQKELNIDPRRLYITGLSMGGFATWDLITRHPATFAAAVPVCGGADEAKAPLIKDLPLWVFHGEKDTVVKTLRSRNMVAALQQAGASPKYTQYPNVGHDAWSKAYADPDLLPWLFSQQRPTP